MTQDTSKFTTSELWSYLREIFSQRIVYLDGAMGTTLQQYKLSEEDYRGERFKKHVSNLRNNSDILNLTQPKIVREIYKVSNMTNLRPMRRVGSISSRLIPSTGPK